MANIKSAKKRILVNQAKTEQNKRLKTNLKTVLKKAEAAIENNAADKDAAVKLAVKKGNFEKEYRFQKKIQAGCACKQSQRLIFVCYKWWPDTFCVRLFILKFLSRRGNT